MSNIMYPMVTINNEEKYIIKYDDFYRFALLNNTTYMNI